MVKHSVGVPDLKNINLNGSTLRTHVIAPPRILTSELFNHSNMVI